MNIKTEQDMVSFCEQANKQKKPFTVGMISDRGISLTAEWEQKNKQMIEAGVVGKGSHLQQGIDTISVDDKEVILQEIPYLYPSPKLLLEHPTYTGSMTGNLTNCCDPAGKLFLFHMRGTNISAPFGFQAAAAGMGKFREHPYFTAKKELAEEASIEYPVNAFNGKALDVLPFMKGGKIPQPLFSFGFLNDLSHFPVQRNLDDIAAFEANIKKGLQEKTIEQKEGYHFTIPYQEVEKITGELHNQKRFYGPIFDSTINFMRALKDSRYI